MTVMEFFGCSFIAFGPPLALFIFTIATDPLKIIVLMASAFFWLLSLLISSLLWFAVVPLKDKLVFGLVFSVLFQELGRLVFYAVIRKAGAGLQRVSQQEGVNGVTLVTNKNLMAYVAGLGFGLISGAFAMINTLADSVGPGTIGIKGDSDLFFITSAFLTVCMIFLHVFWSVVFFAGLDRKNYVMPITVVLSHMLVSCLTLLNQRSPPLYYGSIPPAYFTLLIFGMWAFKIAGGSAKNMKAFLTNTQRSYGME